MVEKKQTFLVTVAILEGRHYAWLNMDSAVIVAVSDKYKTTAVKKSTDSPFYNEYFVFEFNTGIDKFLDKSITITVIQPGSVWRNRKTLGFVTLDVATVWNQKNHHFYHKWAILTSPKVDTLVGPRGYIKLDLSILAKGETPKIPLNVVNDEIEGNLLLPDGVYSERQKAFYVFDVYKCTNLIEKSTQVINDAKTLNVDDDEKCNLSTFVEITFAGISVRTSVKKNTRFPEFNQRLTIIDLFPPLCQRIKIEICYADIMKKTVHSVKHINFKLISNEKEEGFLPTLGPIYLHMYGTNLEGYSGSILLAMDTELDEILNIREVTMVKSIAPIDEKQFFTYEDVMLLGCIFDVSAINKKYKDRNLAIRMAFGKVFFQRQPSESGEDAIINSTIPQKPQKSQNCYYLKYDGDKECMWIQIDVPYFRKRIYNCNVLSKIAKELRERLDKIQQLLDDYEIKLHTTEEINREVIEALDFVLTSCNKYLDIAHAYEEECVTKLDKERKRMCMREIKNIVNRSTKLYESTSKTSKIRMLEKFYRKINDLIEDVQDCWPDIFLWIISDNKKVSHRKIAARDVVYSPVEEERGEYCGVKRAMCFYTKEGDGNLVAMVDLMLLMCLKRHKKQFMSIIPKGFKFKKEMEYLPRTITAKEKSVFQLIAYILVGDVTSGFDKTGLADPFVRVLLGHQVKETKSVHNCLNPVWNETLVFNNIPVYGAKEQLQENVPKVLVELFDKDMFGDEIIGRSIITPELEKPTTDNLPINLKWHKVYFNREAKAEILAAFTLIEATQTRVKTKQSPHAVVGIPKLIKPELVWHRIEVLFWGMRDLSTVNLFQINRPRLSIIVQNDILLSDTIENARMNPNFSTHCKKMDMVLPVVTEYTPPLIIKLFDSRSFGIFVYAGVHITRTSRFKIYPITSDERDKYLSGMKHISSTDILSSETSSSTTDTIAEKNYISDKDVKKQSFFGRLFGMKSKPGRKLARGSTYELLPQDDEVYVEDFDWWSKFYASLEESEGSSVSFSGQKINTLKVYRNELEKQDEFNGFNDIITCFDIFKGKRTGDEQMDEENITAVFKGSIKIYRWPFEDNQTYVHERGHPLEEGVFQNFPDNKPLRYLLRVYCVRGLGLRPKDLNGRSDPYLYLTLGEKIVDDQTNVVTGSVNPVFGSCFEFHAMFPHDHTLKVAIWDYDMSTADDLIGETEIDLEKRFYTQHRANCGIPETYEESGYCEWRGQYKPSAILADICRKWKLAQPEYKEASVCIGFKEFTPVKFTPTNNRHIHKEILALHALRRWDEMPLVGFPLVPEYVETRSLYNPSKPGIEQGKIQLWIDILPVTDLPPPKKVNITPRKPVKYELRIIVWNTDDVVLDEDEFFTGESKSDIYIKGWLIDSSQAQYTDVHYRSISGEGNFNWRFIFPFEYLPTENKLVVRKKESIFSEEETEYKLPCKLTLQVWDNDTFSKDDFLGSLTLELAKLRRGARSVKKCDLSLLQKGAPTLNLFKIRRTKGWWPFRGVNHKTKEQMCTGKIEIELEMLTHEEAIKEPAGMGRNEPQPLPFPNRPDTSFSWFRNPLKALRYVCCKLYFARIICVLLILALVIFFAIAFYALPGYTVKKLLGT